jgi:hypothetical protein
MKIRLHAGMGQRPVREMARDGFDHNADSRLKWLAGRHDVIYMNFS